MTDHWHELAKRLTASERTYRDLAEDAWKHLDVNKALHYRGMADGLEMARDHQIEVSRQSREAQP